MMSNIISKRWLVGNARMLEVESDPTTTNTDANAADLLYYHPIEGSPAALYMKTSDGNNKDAQKIVRRSNLSATTNPTTTDDLTKGFDAGSEWLNQTTKKLFKCFDSSLGASVWVQIN